MMQLMTAVLTNDLASLSFCSINRSQEGAGLVAADRKSLTLPVSRNRAGLLHARLQQLGTVENAHTFNNGECVLCVYCW